MTKTGYEELLSAVILWNNVIWQPPSGDDPVTKRCSISIFSDDIKAGLQIPDYKWKGEAQKISRFMKGKVELRRDECPGLKADICWSKVDKLKKDGSKIPLNGYCIEFTGDMGCKAYRF